ncbi:hypothetical protein [Kitasatospora sp. NPDC094015]|uniref:hypothetical protein n=1 Tax=Kitasatospora sp. NPDC094015 TaxID=3155205 RepID=UPI0033169F42
MHIHRSAHPRNFTVLPNCVLQDRRLSYTARGLLADLLSRPDGWREDGRRMADTSPQGRGAIRRALRELTEAGFYRVDKVRGADGTVRSEAHVFDTPQRGRPDVPLPAAGEPNSGATDALPSKDHEKEPPARPEAVATLIRVLGPEPRLRLAEAEARHLAPLVSRWLERGSTPADLARALLPDLPPTVHSPVGLLRSRLRSRPLPPVEHRSRPAFAECTACHDPVPRPGLCPPCTGLVRPRPAVGQGAPVTPAGAARARAAMRGAGAAASRGSGPGPSALPIGA